MIEFEDMDARLKALGKDRGWLSEVTPYKPNSIRQALAPSGGARGPRLQKILSDAIEKEEAARRVDSPPAAPGLHQFFQTADQLDRADRASRLANYKSLAEFCRDAIQLRADELLNKKPSSTVLPASRITYPSAADERHRHSLNEEPSAASLQRKAK
jgi:hypothetical protein